TGIWVNVGALRAAAIAACSPIVADAVVAGHDRDAIGLLLIPNLAACRALCPELSAEATAREVAAAKPVRDALRLFLRRHNEASPGSSARITRALFLTEPLS